MRHLLSIGIIVLLLLSCKPHGDYEHPEPTLELGQLANFHGADPNRSYIIIGYRHYLESKTDKYWDDHAYIVFLYINDSHDIKQAVIHRNSVLKQ
jgi:hypothetical protein